jgi:hypothetical protein
MAGPKKPPPKGGKAGDSGNVPKPFLGDDLNADLDAWDATFDALHGGPDALAPADETVMTWPAPSEPLPEKTKVTTMPPPVERELTDEDRHTLERAISEVDV